MSCHGWATSVLYKYNIFNDVFDISSKETQAKTSE